jgi:VWFA-related protein
MIEPTILTRREILLAAASMIASNVLMHSREASKVDTPNISVDVEVVSVYVTVRDKNGTIVRGLAQEDFSISEDGIVQTIEYFTRESDAPLTVGLVVDTTPSEQKMLAEEQKAIQVFLKNILRPGRDNAFLIQYSDHVELLQDLTSSREALESSLKLLTAYSESGDPRSNRGRRRSWSVGSDWMETILGDAVTLASDEVMKFQKGRKALIILGDGAHIGYKEKDALNAALEADTQIYAIRIVDKDFGSIEGGPQFGGFGGFGGFGSGSFGRDLGAEKKNLKRITGATGGSFFEANKKESLDQILAQIEEELRSQYSLGYTPGANARHGYRTIKIRTQKKGMVAHGREGYYPSVKK